MFITDIWFRAIATTKKIFFIFNIPPQLPFLRQTNPLGQSPAVPAGFPFPNEPAVSIIT